MGKFIRAFFWLLMALAFGYDLYLWGGLALTPGVGPRLREQASLQTPIAATYLFIGRKSVTSTGNSAGAVDYAARQFPGLVKDLDSSRQSIVDRFLSAQSARGTAAYYGAPILLVLSLVLHLLRQKQVRSFGNKG
jgi:hypothetical protein